MAKYNYLYYQTILPYFFRTIIKKEVNYKSKMIDYINAEKIVLYNNTQRKTIKQIKAELGCTHARNAGFFLNNFLPTMQLKINGEVLAWNQYNYWGYAWNDINDFTMVDSLHSTTYKNFIVGICAVRNSAYEPLYYNSDMGGSRGRSAIGIMPDNKIMLYCTKDNTSEDKTLEELQEYLLDVVKPKSAIILDSGLSSQCDFDGQIIESDRIVSNLFCLWEKKQTVVETPKIIYRVQCGAFSVYANCVSLKTQINSLPDTIGAGYKNAYIRNINGIYKLQIGAFSQKLGAERVLSDLKSKGFNAFITTE
jgi:hypothetical protein